MRVAPKKEPTLMTRGRSFRSDLSLNAITTSFVRGIGVDSHRCDNLSVIPFTPRWDQSQSLLCI